MASTKITMWSRLRRAAGFPAVMVADISKVGFQRYDDIEAGRSEPTAAECGAILAVLVDPVQPESGEDEIRRVLSVNVSSVAKRKNLSLTSDQVEDLATVIANVVKTRLERAFAEEPADTAPGESQGTAAPEEVRRG